MQPTDAQTSEDSPPPRITARQAKGLLAKAPRVSEPEPEDVDFLAVIAADDQRTKIR